VQIVVQTAEVSEFMEPLEEEDSADEDPTVFRSALWEEETGRLISTDPVEPEEKMISRLTFLPMILLSVARLVVLYPLGSADDTPFGTLLVSTSVMGSMLGMIVMEEFLSSSEFFGVFLRAEDVGDLRAKGEELRFVLSQKAKVGS
jgi:hypothetical protein